MTINQVKKQLIFILIFALIGFYPGQPVIRADLDAPTSVTLAYIGQNRDMVGPTEHSSSPDGQNDVELAVNLSSYRDVRSVALAAAPVGIWNTLPYDGYWFVGVAPDSNSPLVNSHDSDLYFSGSYFHIYVSDNSSRAFLPPGTVLTLFVTFTDGSQIYNTVTIPTTVNPPPPVRDGQLYRQNGVIYVISYGQKRAFASLGIFRHMGYKITNVIDADVSQVPDGPGIFTHEQRHPRGTLIFQYDSGSPTSDAGGPYAFYFLGDSQKYQFPSKTIFDCWGNNQMDIVFGNEYDQKVPRGPTVQMPPGGCVEIKNYDSLIDDIQANGDLSKARAAGLLITESSGADEGTWSIDVIHPQTKEILMEIDYEADISTPPSGMDMACDVGHGGERVRILWNGMPSKIQSGNNKIYVNTTGMSESMAELIKNITNDATILYSQARVEFGAPGMTLPGIVPQYTFDGTQDIMVSIGTPQFFEKVAANLPSGSVVLMDAQTITTPRKITKNIIVNPYVQGNFEPQHLTNVMVHEILHALGLSHNYNNPNSIMTPRANQNMYNSIDANVMAAINDIYSGTTKYIPTSSCAILTGSHAALDPGSGPPPQTQVPDIIIPYPMFFLPPADPSPTLSSGYCAGGYDPVTDTCVTYIEYYGGVDPVDPCDDLQSGNNWALCWQKLMMGIYD